MSISKAWERVAVWLWLAAITLFIAAWFTPNGWAGATGLIVLLVGCMAAYKAGES